ncbi:MAG: hypothetical protein HRU21_09810 [Pseudomonadales bacterium]|nr:hypothetical protein [Pseudomonadales bacterium]
MTAINDAKFDALVGQGFTGSNNDMELAFLQSLGATANQINDAWLEVAGAFGDQINDAKTAYMVSQGAVGDSVESIYLDYWANVIGGGGPPVDNRTFLFPFTTDGLEVKSGVPVDHQHVSAQTEILDGQLVTYAANVPVISDFGITGRRQDTNNHGYSADVTQLQPTGAFTPDWNYGVGQSDGGITTSYDGTKGTVLQDSSTGEHKIAMAKVIGTTLDASAQRFVVMIVLKPLGGQKFVTLRTNSEDMTVNLEDGSFTGAQFGGYTQLLDDGKVFIYHVARIQGNNAPQAERIYLLDDSQNESFLGDPTKGVEITSAVYANRRRLNQYSPIINDTGAALTRLATTQIFGTVPIAQTDTNFSLYCELTFTDVPATSDGDVLILNYYTDAVFGGGSSPSAGWVLILSNVSGQLNISWVNADGCSEGAGIPISAWPVNETRRILFELDGTTPSIQVDGSTGPQVANPVPVPPSGLGFYGHLVDASALGAATAYVAPKYVMRIEQTGLTLEQAAMEARKPV